MKAPTQSSDGSDAPPAVSDCVLEVRDLSVSYGTGTDSVEVLRGVDLEIRAGEMVGVVGESGSGKSTLGLSLTRLVEHVGGHLGPGSQVSVCNRDVVAASRPELNDIRRTCVSMIFQDPLSALNPVQTVGKQIEESLSLRGAGGRDEAIELLDSTGIREPAVRVDSYPHELSGGMRQRAMIAMALASRPALIIADEPTTALDVTVKRLILDLLRDLADEHRIGLLLITHDMSTIRRYSDRTAVMYAGRVVEVGGTGTIQTSAQHPYSSALIAAVPRLEDGFGQALTSIRGVPPELRELPSGCKFHPRCPRNDGAVCVTEDPPLRPAGGNATRAACHYPGPLEPAERDAVSEPRPAVTLAEPAASTEEPADLVVSGLTKRYRIGGGFRKQWFTAVDDVSFTVRSGETLGLVGESGSGKTTVARCVSLLTRASEGSITFGGEQLVGLSGRRSRELRRRVQVVFQNPGASLDPRWRVGALLAEPMKVHDLWETPGFGPERVAALLERVGMKPADADRYPYEFSGGQRQRIALARGLSVGPELLILDEPVSSLDVSIRAGIIRLLAELQEELRMSYLFIAHDLPLVASFCDRVAVMSAGTIAEIGDVEEVLTRPQHPYTETLLASEL